eukprot:c14535_g1_i1.p1 GENE.c14535_g1_i1~~c14535_g1_i1.p1  ORF type:complete len:229 (-),score=41.34 c14535_g1_i1:421-1107(-)
MVASNTQTDACVFLVGGLPGSGKSSLAQEIVAITNSGSAASFVSAFHIEFDSVEQFVADHGLANPNILDKIVEHLLHHRTLPPMKPDLEFDPARWRFSRELTKNTVSQLIQQKRRDPQLLNFKYLIVCDDTMHYASMRKEYHALARGEECGFFILWVTCPLVTCLERNQSRSRKVPEFSLRRMAEVAEPPSPTIRTFESNSLEVVSTEPIELQSVLSPIASTGSNFRF